LIGGQPFEIPDGDRIIDFTATASILASMGANPPQNTGKGEVFHNNVERLFIFTLPNHLDVALDIQPGRAGQATRGFVALFDGKSAGNGLSIFLVCGFPYGQPFVVFVGQLYGTNLGAFTTAGAFRQVDEAGFLADAGFETPRFPL
jgi:hypothetical protein